MQRLSNWVPTLLFFVVIYGVMQMVLGLLFYFGIRELHYQIMVIIVVAAALMGLLRSLGNMPPPKWGFWVLLTSAMLFSLLVTPWLLDFWYN